MEKFQMLDLIAPLPPIVILCAAMILLLVGAWRGNSSMPLIGIGAMLAIVISAVTQALLPQNNIIVFNGMFVSSGFTNFTKLLVMAGAFFSLLLSNGYYKTNQKYMVAELPVLILLATAGMIFMISSNDLLSLYMSLELQSLALYILAAIHRNSIKSSEAGLKYFVLGALASGLMLYGISFIYGFSGTTNFTKLASLYGIGSVVPVGLIVGFVLLAIGLCFKISAAPFHMWAPDVYEGAPVAVTSFFAVAPKIAAVSLFISVLYAPFGHIAGQWQQVIILISALSMLVGAFGGLRQSNIKRLMAYSSIGHVGYILVGLASASHEGVRGILLYLFIYMTVTLGMFACIMAIKQKEDAAEDIYAFAGLGKNKPVLAMVVAIILLSMAGIPPFAGFFGKYFVFLAAVKSGFYGLAVFGVLSSVVAAFYYLRIIKIMYFDEAPSNIIYAMPYEMKIVAFASGIFNLLFLISLSPVLDWATKAAAIFFE
jgi:NADH-quinone oxidoreductase subunit N